MDELDRTDRGILYVLQTDARSVTNTEIGERVGVSPTTVGDRIDRLRERGILRTTYADIDYERAGIPHTVVLYCTVSAADLEESAAAAISSEGVVSVTELLTGDRNLQITLVGRTNEDVAKTIEAVEELGIEVRDAELLKAEHRCPFDGFSHPGAVD
ncbi:AsnC family transcriptional regulator [Halovivax sp.]|uniref:Lrp/AsnC family transcriptional regulator n=1 Tax=Halovivax sp. TaxID=1935978 RepID=UPI0025C51136|nr:AsnC family transcriptional regulator [Halovivax sp.]